jgi:predicted phosphodiesterase
VRVLGLRDELRGLRIAHLSDFHLGVPGRGSHAVERAAEWVAERQPDLTLVSGDLLTRASGEPLLRRVVAELPRCYAILGNHDLAISRDPFVERTFLRELEPATLLSDEGITIDVRGRRVYIAGADPRSRWARSRPQPADLAVGRDEADLRILIVHFPALVDRLPAGAFDLVVSGHMHDGQICLPSPGAIHARALPAPWRDTACLRRARDHVRAVPLRGAARGDGVGSLVRLTRRWQASEDPTVQAARGVRQSAASGASLSAEPGFAGREPKGGQACESGD